MDSTSKNKSASEMDYESAFEMTGHGKVNNLVLFASICIFMHAIIEMCGFAYVGDPAECDLKLSISEKTLIGSAVFIGIVMTAICWGSITDHLGRRKVMFPAVFLIIVCSSVSSVATKFWIMFVFRLLTGIFVSASSATIFVYLGELEIAKYRDRNISIAITSAAISFIFVAAIGWAIIPGNWSLNMGFMDIKPWRVFMWVWSIPGLLGFIALFFLPESPSFVFSKSSNDKDTLKILSEIYSRNNCLNAASFPVNRITRLGGRADAEQSVSLKAVVQEMSLLVKRPLLRPFFLTHYCMFITFLLANGVYLWTPSIFNILLKDISLPWSICHAIKSKYNNISAPVHMLYDDGFTDDVHMLSANVNCSKYAVNAMVYVMSMCMEGIFAIPFIIITFVIDKVNKCRLYIYLMTPCAVCILLCALVPNIIAAGILLTLGLSCGGGTSILSALAVEAFPIKLRALSMCTMYMMGHIGAIIGNTLVGVGSSGPCILMFVIIFVLVAGSVLLIAFLWPDLTVVKRIMEERNYPY